MNKTRRQVAKFLGKGPNGGNLCFCGCGREVVKPSLNWFSYACVSAWKLINDPGTIRRAVMNRDHGVCALCGVDTVARAREIRDWRPVFSWLTRRHFEDAFERGELEMFPGFTTSEKRYHDYRVSNSDKVSHHDVYLWCQHESDAEISRRFGKGIESSSCHTWEADHIVPVIEGGGQCGLENYRTLCLSCHRKETAALAKRRAEQRRKAKEQSTGQALLVELA